MSFNNKFSQLRGVQFVMWKRGGGQISRVHWITPSGPDCIKGFRFECENDTKSIVSIIGPQNVGPLEPLFDPDM